MSRRLIVQGVLLLATLSAAELSAQSGGSFAIVRSTIDSGATPVSAAPYAVRSTIGQPDAHYSEGGSFAVRGGFWGSAAESVGDTIFSNGFE
jgi:hypothetical protein